MDKATSQSFNHVPGGCNVLYMDGHVEFLERTDLRATLTNLQTRTIRLLVP